MAQEYKRLLEEIGGSRIDIIAEASRAARAITELKRLFPQLERTGREGLILGYIDDLRAAGRMMEDHASLIRAKAEQLIEEVRRLMR